MRRAPGPPEFTDAAVGVPSGATASDPSAGPATHAVAAEPNEGPAPEASSGTARQTNGVSADGTDELALAVSGGPATQTVGSLPDLETVRMTEPASTPAPAPDLPAEPPQPVATTSLPREPIAPAKPVERPSPRKWVQRAEGERRARARLRVIEGEGVIVLNDRRVPGSRASIKVIAVSSSGVFVIDAKSYKGLVHVKRSGPMSNLGPAELHVGKRNCSALVESVAHQMQAVKTALGTTWGSAVPVHGMLCLTRAEWGFASAIEISDVYVGWPSLVAGRVQAPGVMDSPAVQEVAEMITEHLHT